MLVPELVMVLALVRVTGSMNILVRDLLLVVALVLEPVLVRVLALVLEQVRLLV